MRQRFGEVQRHKAGYRPAKSSASATNHQHAAQQRALRRTVFKPVDGAGVANRDRRITVLQAKRQRFGPEQHGQRHRHRTHLQHRDVGHRRLKTLWHDDRHPVASAHALAFEHLRQAIGLGLEFAVAVAGGATGRSISAAHVHAYGHALRCVRRSGPARAAPVRHVEVVGHHPTKLLVQSGVARRKLRLSGGARRGACVSVRTSGHGLGAGGWAASLYHACNVPSSKTPPQ